MNLSNECSLCIVCSGSSKIMPCDGSSVLPCVPAALSGNNVCVDGCSCSLMSVFSAM